MKELPIIFTGDSVRAILAGRKTQTRRIVKPQGAHMFPMLNQDSTPRGDWFISYPDVERAGNSGYFPPYPAGSCLWVREGCWLKKGIDQARYVTDHNKLFGPGWRKRSPIHMPKKHARIWLEVTGVRAERLNDTSEADAEAEGIQCQSVPDLKGNRWHWGNPKFDRFPSAVAAFHGSWISIHDEASWINNPWLWVYEFRRIER